MASALPAAAQDAAPTKLQQVKRDLVQQYDDNLQIYYQTRNVPADDFVQKSTGTNTPADVVGYRTALMAWGATADSMVMNGVTGKSQKDVDAFTRQTERLNVAFNKVEAGLNVSWLPRVPGMTGSNDADAILAGIKMEQTYSANIADQSSPASLGQSPAAVSLAGKLRRDKTFKALVGAEVTDVTALNKLVDTGLSAGAAKVPGIATAIAQAADQLGFDGSKMKPYLLKTYRKDLEAVFPKHAGLAPGQGVRTMTASG
jgi:hypothetical protein